MATWALSLAMPGQAGAGTYQITQCHRGTGAGLDNWRWYSDIWYAHNECVNSVGIRGLNLAGRQAGWQTPLLPSGLAIDRVSFMSESKNGYGVGTFGLLCVNTQLPCAGNGAVALLDQDPNATSESKTVVAPGSAAFELRQASGGAPVVTSAHILAFNFTFTISDSVAPAAQKTGGSLATDGRWNRGTRTADYLVSDGQGGGSSMYVTFDGNFTHPMAVSQSAACDYRRFSPCPATFNGSASVNTASLADGTHTIHLFGYDAGGNVANPGAGLVYAFKVDNSAPDQPGPIGFAVTGQNGWTRQNDFDLSWAATGESAETASQSGLETVWIDLDPTGAGEVNPDPVAVPVGGSSDGVSATDRSLANVSVPGKGAWRATVWTEDRAGNVSAKRDAELRFDPTVPDKAEGIANGWIGRAKLIAGRAQNWLRPRNHRDVASGICGYATAVDRVADTIPAPIQNLVGDETIMPLPASIPEGRSYAHLRAVSCAGVPAAETEHVAVDVDLTDPGLAIAGLPQAPWTREIPAISLALTDSLSGTAPAPPNKPLGEGAFIRYSVDDGPEQVARGAAASVDFAPGLADGVHVLNAEGSDVAGNTVRRPPVEIGIDRTAPDGHFLEPTAADPTLLRVRASDAHAGVASGTIEFAPEGSNHYTALSTELNGGELIASFPDAAAPDGIYKLRAVVIDRAGNTATLGTAADGRPVRVTNPLRRPVRISLGIETPARLCKRRTRRRG
ncbi:MAG: hypothetical protein WAP37_06980, partial [Solirubrobacterales bacterium]